MKLFYSLILLTFCFPVFGQDKLANTITLGTNVGSFDHSAGYGPVFFVDYDLSITKYIKISPHIQIASASSVNQYIDMGTMVNINKMTNSYESGLLLKVVPLPTHFDRLKIIVGFSYLMENTLKSDSGNLSNRNLLKQSGLNTNVGLDLDVIKIKNFRIGLDARVNTSNNRILLYHFGFVTAIRLAN